jgi:hypothetical protein
MIGTVAWHSRLNVISRLAVSAIGSLIVSGFFAGLCWAQTSEQSATYVSQIDQDLTIRRVAVLPVIDNVDGIYARHIEAQLISLVKSAHRWDYVESNIANTAGTATDLEENPAELQKLVRGIEADAFIAANAARGPNGISVKVDLFLKKDGKLLSQEILRDHPRFEIIDMKAQVAQLYKRLVAKLPYSGLILSRQQNRVTINLGKTDGIVKDQTLPVIQIISVTRHPKFNFIIATDKEILGHVKVLKVDETLSFGAIVSEKERGAIGRHAKIAALEPVSYPVTDLGSEKSNERAVTDRPDAAVTFGKEPREWLPVRPPSFGQVGIKAGFGTYSSSVNLNTTGALEAHSSLYPAISVNGELWLNPNWIVRAEITQGVLATNNPRANSTPGTLNHAMSRYSLALGYNFLMRDDFFGPKLNLNMGMMSYRMYVDDSTPQALTTVNYSGYVMGLGGSFPLNEEKIWYLGGQFNLVLLPRLSESPDSSGNNPNSTINDFSLFVERKIAENLRATGSIDFSLYSTNFGGGAGTRMTGSTPDIASSLSQRHMLLSAGVVYMF